MEIVTELNLVPCLSFRIKKTNNHKHLTYMTGAIIDEITGKISKIL